LIPEVVEVWAMALAQYVQWKTPTKKLHAEQGKNLQVVDPKHCYASIQDSGHVPVHYSIGYV